jgi:hypothetical protein
MTLRLGAQSRLRWAATILLLALPLAAQEAPLRPAGNSWAANDALYWGLPTIALLLSWIAGIGWHFGEARKQYAEWPATTASGSFGSLCGLPIALTIVLFLAVAGFFVYLWFGPPELADEWIAHQKTAFWAWPLCVVVALMPWATVTSGWRRA